MIRQGEEQRSAPATDHPPGGALTGAEQQRVIDALAGLRTAVGAILEWLPLERRRQSDIAAFLNLDRISIQRLIAVSRGHGAGLDALRRAPGVRAVEQFRAASERVNAPAKLLSPLDEAIRGYRDVLHDLGGSKSAVERRLRSTLSLRPPGEAGVSTLDARMSLFRSAASVLGRQMRARMDMTIFWPSASDGDKLDCVHTRGVLGHQARPDARPMTIEFMGAARGEDAGGEHDRGDGLHGVLSDFSTEPPPVVVSRGLGGRYRHVFDSAYTAGGRAVDLVVSHRARGVCDHPIQEEEGRRLEVGALLREPAESLLLDAYFHRDVLRGVIPEAELYVWSPTLGASLDDHWLDRVEPAPPLECLGSGIARCATPLHDRHAELTRSVFENSGLDPDSFVGYRCCVRYPLWGGGYFITLDFSAM
ncbi:MAG: hypothetical protein CMJ31_02160 [Phycisphaerae bacterium]|nr:hypothetical protein [Phycisphaerae bacterium]